MREVIFNSPDTNEKNIPTKPSGYGRHAALLDMINNVPVEPLPEARNTREEKGPLIEGWPASDGNGKPDSPNNSMVRLPDSLGYQQPKATVGTHRGPPTQSVKQPIKLGM